MTVLLKCMHRAFRRINWEISEIRSSQPFYLSIEIGKIASLKKWIVAEIDARHYVRGAKRHLFGLGEKIVYATIEYQTSDLPYGKFFFRYDLSCIQDVKIKFVSEVLIEQL